MKFTSVLVAGLLLSTTVFADDDKSKPEENPVETKSEASVESSSVSTVTVMVIGEDGKIVEKSTTSKTSADGPQKLHVQMIDGKKVIEITAPDGTKRTINVGSAVASDVVGKVMSWTFKAGKDEELGEVKQIQEQIAKVLKDLDVPVTLDAQEIANQVKAAIIQVRPVTDVAKEITGEVLLEIGDSAFIVDSGEADRDDKDQKKVRRPIEARRIIAAGGGMIEVMKKLDEITKRLEKIESRLDSIDQE